LNFPSFYAIDLTAGSQAGSDVYPF